MFRKCIQCPETFELSEGDVEWFTRKGWPVPARCRRCRWKTRLLSGGLFHPLGGEFQAKLK